MWSQNGFIFPFRWGDTCTMYSCELINAYKSVTRRDFYTTDDTAFENRLVWLLSFTEITNNTDLL